MKLTEKDYGATNFVTGVRAWAALAVVLIHSGGAGLRSLGELGNRIADFGSTGVYAFFVISGFSVCHSYIKSINFKHYLLKRLARIAPIYFIFIIFFGVIGGAEIETILLHLIFLSWLDHETANSIILVEWSIPVEIFWYLFIPSMLVFILNRRFNWFMLLVISFSSYLIASLTVQVFEISPLALHWSPFRYFFVFALGVVAYAMRTNSLEFLERYFSLNRNQISNIVIVLVSSLFLSHCVKPFLPAIVISGVATALLILYVNNHSLLSRIFFSNSLSQSLGKISYSIYLWHFPVINWLNIHYGMKKGSVEIFVFTIIFTSILSLVTYILIEKNSIKLGQKIAIRVWGNP